MGVTGSLNELGGYSLAFFLAAGAAALAVLIVLPTREKRRLPQQPSVGTISSLIARPDVLLPSLLAALSQYANWATTFGFVAILARQLGATDVSQSVLMSMHTAVVILGNLVTTVIVRRVGARRLVYLGFAAIGGDRRGSARSLAAVGFRRAVLHRAGAGHQLSDADGHEHSVRGGRRAHHSHGAAPGRVRCRHVRRALAKRYTGRRCGHPADVRGDGLFVPGAWFVRYPLANRERDRSGSQLVLTKFQLGV